jgi:hypothetical protein
VTPSLACTTRGPVELARVRWAAVLVRLAMSAAKERRERGEWAQEPAWVARESRGRVARASQPGERQGLGKTLG